MEPTHHAIVKFILRSASSEGYEQNEMAHIYFCTGRYRKRLFLIISTLKVQPTICS